MSILIQHLLVATDFSLAAKHALDYASEFAARFGAQLHLLHVVVEPMPVAGADVALIRPTESVATMIQHAESELAAVAASLLTTLASKPACTVEVGYPIEEILKYVQDHSIDMIVVGTHGHRGLSHLILGSVAEKLVRMAACPVLTVHAPSPK